MGRTTDSNNVISFLRFPLLMGVLFAHSYNSPSHPVSNLFENIVSYKIAEACVPAYFFISGYLFFRKVDKFDFTCYKSKISKRVSTLLIPFIIWNLTPVFFQVFQMVLLHLVTKGDYLENLTIYFKQIDWFNLFWDDNYYMENQTFNIFGWPIKYTFTHNGPMWYIRDLIVICLASPIIYYGIVKLKKAGLLILGLLYIFMIYPYVTIEFRGIFLFYLGSWYAINKKDLVPSKYATVLVHMVTLLSLIAFSFLTGAISSTAHNIYSIFSVFTCIIIGASIVGRLPMLSSFITKCGKYAFFTYALHNCILWGWLPLTGFIGFYLNRFMNSHIISYLLTPFVVFILCAFIYEFLGRFTPKLLKILVGGRL